MENHSSDGLFVEILGLARIPQDQVSGEFEAGFAYTIKVKNQSDKKVRLLGRKWMIKQEDGQIETVEGEGVVGEQPEIEPGADFVYTSFCLLTGKKGSMWGLYIGQDEDGTTVLWQIPRFDMNVEHRRTDRL